MELVNGEDGVSDQWRMILLSLNHDSIYVRICTWRIICTTQIDFAYEYTSYYLYSFVNSLVNSYVYMRVNVFSLQANTISTNRDSTQLVAVLTILSEKQICKTSIGKSETFHAFTNTQVQKTQNRVNTRSQPEPVDLQPVYNRNR